MSVQAKQPKKKAPKKPFLSLERKNSVFGYVFTLPIIVGLFLIYIPVLFNSLRYAFGTIDTATPGWPVQWAGFENFRQALFVEEGFLQLVVESTISLLPQIIVVLIFAFFMANVLNQKFYGRTIARVIFFIPVIASTGIMSQFEAQSSLLDSYMNNTKMDVTGAGAGASLVDFTQLQNIISSVLGNSDLSSVVISAINGLYGVVTSSGVQMLVFLSGLQGISINMYEAAKVEGATGWEVFWKISFPMISPLILVNLIYTVIDLFLKADNKAIQHITAKLASGTNYEIASAYSWIYTIVVLLFVAIVWLLVKKLIVYQD